LKCTEWLLKTEFEQQKKRRLSLTTILSSSPDLLRSGDQIHLQELMKKDQARHPYPNISVNPQGWTPLFLACYEGRDEILNMMLKLNEDRKGLPVYVDVNERNKAPDMRYPLHGAVNRRRESIVLLLLENGADPNKFNQVILQVF
jgi:hypothetical protein